VSTAVRLGSITTDRVKDLMQAGQRSGSALVSQGSSMKKPADGQTTSGGANGTDSIEENERRHGSAELKCSKRRIYNNV